MKTIRRAQQRTQKTAEKIYLSRDEQVQKLRNDGLIIHDEKRAKYRLKWEGYYNFAVGYNRIFRDENRRYYQDTTFEQLEAIYDFDKHLRGIVYEYAQSVECTLKALISDEFSRKYGVKEREYLAEENFTDEPNEKGNVRWLVATCREALRDAGKQGTSGYKDYVAHNAKTYGHVPLWALIRSLSFGNTSKFLKLMKREDKAAIASEYNLSQSMLCNMMEVAVCFRNVAAHGERTFCTLLSSVRLSEKLPIFRSLQIPKKADGTPEYGRSDFMAFLICLKHLLPHGEFAECLRRVRAEVDVLSKSLPPFIMRKVYEQSGLSGAWRKLDIIKIYGN